MPHPLLCVAHLVVQLHRSEDEDEFSLEPKKKKVKTDEVSGGGGGGRGGDGIKPRLCWLPCSLAVRFTDPNFKVFCCAE